MEHRRFSFLKTEMRLFHFLTLLLSTDAFISNNPQRFSFLKSSVDDKTEVKEYFNSEGFSRWNKIYSDSSEVNQVQLDIRNGHDQTISKVLNWLKGSKGTLCDCGCGVGSLAIPLAQQGFDVVASDLSESMANEAKRRAEDLGITNVKFYTSDLLEVEGSYDTVTCIDVAIHYPSDKMNEMITHLCGLSDKVIMSFAPKTWYYSALKKIGELFPGPSKTTRAYLHEEELIKQAFQQAGYTIQRTEMTGTNFYFSRLIEATKQS